MPPLFESILPYFPSLIFFIFSQIVSHLQYTFSASILSMFFHHMTAVLWGLFQPASVGPSIDGIRAGKLCFLLVALFARYLCASTPSLMGNWPSFLSVDRPSLYLPDREPFRKRLLRNPPFLFLPVVFSKCCCLFSHWFCATCPYNPCVVNGVTRKRF